MSVSTFVISYTYTVTYITAKMLHLLSNIIRDIGLDPCKFAKDWAVYEDGISTWLASSTESEGRSSPGRESSTWLDSRFSILGG
jgi:hypothetical protein